MWIVKLAIDRPYTFVVVAILLALISVMTAMHMAVDIFPNIDIPVVSVIWSFTGLSPEEMEQRIVTISERAMTMVTSDIEHMESVSLSGIGIIRVFLHQGANVGTDVALMSAINQMELIDMPPGITPPAVVAFSATDVPVMQLGVGSKILTEAQLYDYDLNFIRTRLATVGGASLPLPYGGKQRDVMVDLYPDKLLSRGVSANDVVNALSLQNIILPAGIARFGTREFPVRLNGSPRTIEEFNDLPIKQINNATVYIRDIGHAHDGYTIQTNIVRMDGKRATLLNILRAGGASTLTVVQGIKDTLPLVRAMLPQSLKIQIVNDQSTFVRGAITQVIHEAIVAAALTGLLMLALLGSWRSTLIVAISIPLSIMTSIIGLGICGQTLNAMTLGGLSLAVGMLVDDATVEVENIHRNLALRLPLKEAVLTSAAEVALPAFVSTVSICIVFIPVVLLTEPSRSLFVPLGMAVVFAMMASYFLSRTLVPVMSTYLLKSEELPGAKMPEGMTIEEAARKQAEQPIEPDDDAAIEGDDRPSPPQSQFDHEQQTPRKAGWLGAVSRFVDRHFHSLRHRYHAGLEHALARPKLTIVMFIVFYLLSACLTPFVGQDFFPVVDAAQMRLHLICPVGTRVEETARYFSRVETAVRRIIPAKEIASISLNIGTPASGLSLCYGDNTNYTEFDGEMLITLEQGNHGSTFEYQKRIRRMLTKDFPMITSYFQPADITTQILNAGLQAPIDVQVTGLLNRDENYDIAQKIKHDVALIPGAVDVLVRQAIHQPQINVDVDRTRAIQLGLSQHDVSSSVLTSLSSSFQTAPSFWVNPDNGVNYTVAVQTPLYKMRSMGDLIRILLTGTSGLLSAFAQPTNTAGATSAAAASSAPPPAVPVQVVSAVTPVPPAISSQAQPSIQTELSALVMETPTSSQEVSSTSELAGLTPASSSSRSSSSAFSSSPSTSAAASPQSTISNSATTIISSPASFTSTSISAPTFSAVVAANLSADESSSAASILSAVPTTVSPQAIPSTTAVQQYTSPSTTNIPAYVTTSLNPNPTTPQTTLPESFAPTTLAPTQSNAVTVLTNPSTVTFPTPIPSVTTLTTPSFRQIAPYLTTISSPIEVSVPPAAPAATMTPQPKQTTSSSVTSAASTTIGPTSGAATSAPPVSASSTSSTAGRPLGTASASTMTSAQTTSPARSRNNRTASETNGLGVYIPTAKAPGVASLLVNMSGSRRTPTSAMVSHYSIQPVFDVFANTQGRDLGGVARDVQQVIDRYRTKAPAGTLIYMRGQADSMNKAFSGLIVGMVFALILIYLLLVVNFQSWLDPLIILMAIPGALAGIVWSLFITQTTFSVPALMGAIMSIGVGSANSILMVNFANEQHRVGASPTPAASKAGLIRFRPVLMTAMAMVVGMLPMASGLGEGGGQNAPLGRAVIGGLIVATFSTLFFVPVVYSLMKRKRAY